VAVIVRLPAMLQDKAAAEVTIDEPVSDVASVYAALQRKYPALAEDLGDPIFNVAINDVMLLHGVRHHPVANGDVVELVPTIAGGADRRDPEVDS
jgi:molybdopterin converting factor small subunit